MDALPRVVDRRGLFFTPLGLGGPMRPDVAQELVSRECGRLALHAVVPESVREEFAKVVRHYADGLFTYANYTSASREAHRVLEVALKVRFLEHYAAGVPLISGGVPEIAHPRNFDELRHRLGRDARLRGYRRFNGSLASLLYWARREAYFYGQRNRVREVMTRKIRNEEMHSEFPYVFMPPDTLRRLHLVSEMIARLWGADMPSRTVYPGTIERELMVVGQGPLDMEGTQFLLEQLAVVNDDQAHQRRWYVVLGTWQEQLVWWTPDLETMGTPVTRLWGPGTWDELKEAVVRLSPDWRSDTARVVDRAFYVRVVGGGFDHARSAAQLLALSDRVEDERWFVVLADAPVDALGHVQRVLAGTCKPHGCSCPVHLIFDRANRDTVVKHAVRSRRRRG